MNTFRRRSTAVVALAAMASSPLGASQPERRTVSPIKHVIVLIGENRTFDNVFGTYVPRRGQSVSNLLSKGIVLADGSPGPRKNLARQFHIDTIHPVTYFVNANELTTPKAPYTTLPTPEAGFAPPQTETLTQFLNDPVSSATPFDAATFSRGLLGVFTAGLEKRDLHLLTTGATGFANCQSDPTKAPFACPQPDTRIPNYAHLPNTMFPLSGPSLPYDSYSGDMVHRLFHMWQQSDCDVANATPDNPAGCLNDLYPFVGIARGDDSGANAMGFYNMQAGAAPLFKRLADEFTISDNFHQSVMGGTGVQHIMLGAADSLPWEPTPGFPAQPPAAQVADPTPRSSTNVAFVKDQRWTNCGDPLQPGIKPIQDYLQSLPWHPNATASNCEPGVFYMINNTRPAYLSNGELNVAAINAGTAAPPSSLRTIGDALNDQHISWAFYGGGYNAAARFDDGSTDPIDRMIGTGGDWYCDICNPFQYARSIMGDPAQREAHIKDVIDFFDDLDRGRLPAVSYLKPDSFVDGHPGYSKLDLFEGMTAKVLDRLQAHPELLEDTAVFVTFDEGGGYWDSGFFQPIDFFGDGPRIPLIAISQYSRGGKVAHSYSDHASIVKFIERNWRLTPLTARSRDNLPNPTSTLANPYVPLNMPAISDLFELFDFGRDHDDDHR